MSKKSIASKLSRISGKPVSECIGIVEDVFDAIRMETNANKRLVIRGFGSFTIQNTQDRNGRNPKSGEKLLIKGRKKVKFTQSQNFFKQS